MADSFDTLDDMLHYALLMLKTSNQTLNGKRGDGREVLGTYFTLRNPRARISHSATRCVLVSALGETLWYLRGSTDLSIVEHYIPSYRKYADGSGAYGPRLVNATKAPRGGQLGAIVELLRARPSTKRALLPVFRPQDLSTAIESGDVPCTCSLQFLLREGRLHLYVYMRSNDVFRGLPHDVFAFTFIQELIASELRVELGLYTHMVGSLHSYADDFDDVEEYLEDGKHEPVEMAPMPPAPYDDLAALLKMEERIRFGEHQCSTTFTDPYWTHLQTLLYAYAVSKTIEIPPTDKLHLLRSLESSLKETPYKPTVARFRRRVQAKMRG
jgi:thymidylate synthase